MGIEAVLQTSSIAEFGQLYEAGMYDTYINNYTVSEVDILPKEIHQVSVAKSQ